MTNLIRAVIFDWAGTVVDFGSRAPVAAFVELFRRNGVELSESEARGPMGIPKKDHIRALLALPCVAGRWRARHGVDSTQADVDRLYQEFQPIQTEAISHHCDVIPGTPAVMDYLRLHSIRTGSTTGYARAMMGELVARAARDGFDPECTVCADEVPRGRPAPWMAVQALMLLDAFPVTACVKVGDTIADIQEGRNAGMWTVAVVRTGNEVGLSATSLAALEPDERARRIAEAAARLQASGPDYMIGGVDELPPVLDDIATRIRHGERPR